jgi:hypothetical protein
MDRMLEAAGNWISIEPCAIGITTTSPNAAESISRPAEMQTPPTSKPARRLPDVHPGAPARASVELVARIVKRTLDATLIELPDDPRGQVWVSRKQVLPGGHVGRFGCEKLHMPVWLYRKIREQL